MTKARLSALRSSASLACLGLALSATPTLANPTGGQISSGAARISAPSASKTVVNQSSQGVVINWKSFDIDKGQTTQFVQPNAKSVAVNRIGGQNASQILGTLSANGKVVLINPNGIAFGEGSKVNVGALVATTTDGSDSDLLSGRFNKAGSATGYVTNAGRITANGTVALVAPNVSNSGVVNAKIGSVSLGGTNKFTVDFNGDGLVSFAAGDASKASVSNTGKITGANVSMTARTAEGLATGVVNTSGIVTATGANKIGGSITLDAGDGGSISVTGAKIVATGQNGGGNITVGGWNHGSVTVDKASSIDASAIGKGNAGNVSVIAASATVKGSVAARGGKTGNGGKIETSGHTVDFGGARIDAGAKHGTSGQWLLDPVDITVDATGAATIMTALATSDVSLVTELDNVHPTQILYDTIPGYTPVETSGPGDFYLMAPITWSSSHQLQIGANHSVYLYAPITVAGSGTLQILDNYSNNGSGGIIDIAAPVNFLQPANGHLNINGFNFTLETSFASLVTDVNANPAGYFALASDVSAAGTTYTTAPITAVGLSSSGVNNINLGIVEGLGHSISGLTVQTSGSDNAALIGTVYAAGTVENLHLTDVSVSSAGSGSIAAALAAVSNRYSLFTNDSSSGTVSSAASAGGLIGNNTATVTLSWSSADVTGVSVGAPSGLPAAGVGGLVAWNNYVITDSYATGGVTGSGDYLMIGGFVGLNWNSISNSYATGNVLATGPFTFGILSEGGFVGQNAFNVDHSYETGSVTAQGLITSSSAQIGGFSGRAGSTGMILDTVYASGRISVPSFSGIYVGGIAGGNVNVVKNSVWDTDSTGVAAAVGVGPSATNTVSVNSSTRYTASAYTPFTFTTTPNTANDWVMIGADSTVNGSGGTRPMLAMEYSPIINNLHQLQLAEMNLSSTNFYLNNDIDASATGAMTDVWGTAGFVPLGSQQANTFAHGNFYGQGHTISDLTINSGLVFVGLFGITAGSTVSNITIVDPSITAYGGGSYAGALSGENSATISNVSIKGGFVTNATTGAVVGGLTGMNWGGAIGQSSSTTTVTGGSSALAGGLVGWNRSGSSIAQSFAAGAVSGGSGSYLGGLVGMDQASISDSFAMGNVTGSAATIAGGLVGSASSDSITSSFSTGMVTGADTTGGAIGSSSSTLSNIYWDTDTSGILTGISGTTGKTTSQLQASLLTGLDDGNWSIVAGKSFPYLNWMLPNGTPQVISGKLYSDRGVTALVNGGFGVAIDGRSPTPLAGFTATGSGGYFYELLSPGTVSSGGSNVAVYATGTRAALTYTKATDTLTDLALYGGWTRYLTSDANYTQAAAGFAAAVGGLSVLVAPNLEVDALASSFVFNANPGYRGNKLMIVSNGYVSESVPLTVDKLIVGGTGTFALSYIYNHIGSVSGDSGSTTGNNGALRLLNAEPLTVENTTIHELTLQSDGAITVSGAVNTVYATLQAGGTVKSIGAGKITAIEAYVTSIGGLSLTGANNIKAFSTLYNENGGDLVLNNNADLQIGGYNSSLWGNLGGGKISISASGDLKVYDNLVTSSDLALRATGALSIFSTISSGRTLTLSANSIDSSRGALIANTLVGSTAGAANMSGINNITMLGNFTTGGAFSLFNNAALNITGIVDGAGHALTLETVGTMTIRGGLSGSTLTLTSDAGAVLEKGDGYVDASLLNLSASTGYNLSGSNNITALGTIHTATGQKKLVQHGAT